MNHSPSRATATAPLAAKPLPANSSTRERDGQWLLIAGGVLLGTIGVFVEEAGQHPLVTVWFRCAFGALALLAWCLGTGRGRELLLSGKARWLACATGVLMVLNWALFFAAIPRTSIAVATVIFHIQPIWVIVFGALFLREAISLLQWVATVAALAGLVLTTGLLDGAAAAAAAASHSPGYVAGVLMCLGGSLCYAGVTLLANTQKAISPYAMALWQCLVGAVALAWAPWVLGWPPLGAAWAGCWAWACCTRGWPMWCCLRAWRAWGWVALRCCSFCTRSLRCWWIGPCMAARSAPCSWLAWG